MLSVDIQRKDVICLEARNNPGEAFEDGLMTERQCIRRSDTWDANHLRSGLIWNQRNKQNNSAVSMDPVRNFDRFAQIWIFVDDKPTELISSNWIDVWIRASHNQKGSICALSRSDDARCTSNPEKSPTTQFRASLALQTQLETRTQSPWQAAKRDGANFDQKFSAFLIIQHNDYYVD